MYIDSGGSQEIPEDLLVGTQLGTADLYLGKMLQDVNILGDVKVGSSSQEEDRSYICLLYTSDAADE